MSNYKMTYFYEKQLERFIEKYGTNMNEEMKHDLTMMLADANSQEFQDWLTQF
mgnify:CR=1 FL=1